MMHLPRKFKNISFCGGGGVGVVGVRGARMRIDTQGFAMLSICCTPDALPLSSCKHTLKLNDLLR